MAGRGLSFALPAKRTSSNWVDIDADADPVKQIPEAAAQDDDVDPLDAFMAELDQDMKAAPSSGGPKVLPLRDFLIM
jgi:hypothetical protein